MIRLATDPDPPGRPWHPASAQAPQRLDAAGGARRRIRPPHAWPFLSRSPLPVPEASSPPKSPERIPGVP